MRLIVTEQQFLNLIKHTVLKESGLLKEGREANSFKAAKKLLIDSGNFDDQSAEKALRIDFRNDIPILRSKKGAAFFQGVVRLFLDGQLNNAQSLSQLNTVLKYIASDAHFNEYDNNLNGEDLQTLIDRFAQNVTADLEADKKEVSAAQYKQNDNYKIIPINSFEESSQYEQYTSWCITYDDVMFDSYTNGGIAQFYFCLRNGFENEPMKKGENYPLDSYGLSMIAVCVDENGSLKTCTCRWNHGNGGNDNIMTTKQISEVIGRNFYEVFKPDNKWKNMIEDAIKKYNAGGIPEEIFDTFDPNPDVGFARVKLSRKWNFINKNGLLSNQWFDNAGDFHEGFAMVKLSEKWNFINKEGKYLSKQWFDNAGDFYEGFAMVKLSRKWNFINKEGKYLSKQWFDNAGDFHEGFAMVKLSEKWNFINKEGEILIPNQWFDNAGDFHEGFAMVKLSEKWNFINKEGKYLTKQWFDNAGDFHEGFAMVELRRKWNFINKEGKILIPNQWFARVFDFHEGFASIKLNPKCNFINKEGKYLSKQWFDDTSNFRDGFANVYFNKRWYKIDTNGEIYKYNQRRY